MPPGSSEYTLVGFWPELDWRPLSFVKPIPHNRVCSACGLVRKRTALLPCVHVLCEACYEQSSQEGTHVCPLDGHECHDEEDVDWKDFPADQLLKREVRCWNQEHGCTSVMAVSEVSRHFRRECGHHSVSCPKCSAGILCRDVCSHLRSGCATKATPLGSEAAVQSECKDDIKFFPAFRAALEKQAEESRKLFERLAVDSAMHGDRLSEVCHAVNTLRETITQELPAETRRNDDALNKAMHDISASTEEVKSCFVTLRDAIINLPGSINTLEKTLKDAMAQGTKGTQDHVSQIATSIKAEVEKNAQTTVENMKHITVSTEEVKSCVTTLRDAIINLPGSIDALESSLKGDVVKEANGTRDHLSQIATSIKAEVENNAETTVENIRHIIRHPQLQATVSIINVRGVEALKRKALNEGCAKYESQKVYMRGYCISPGVYLKKEGESVKLCAMILLRKGDMDDLLQWPFPHKVGLAVVHPKGGFKLEYVEAPDPTFENFQKPTQPENKALYFDTDPLILEELIIDGFVENDTLRVRWELHP